VTGAFGAVLALASVLAAPATGGALSAPPTIRSESVHWTPVDASKFGFRLLMPCAQAEIDAYQQENDFRRKAGAVGCDTNDYKAIAFVMTGMPPSFFADLVTKSRNDRIPPFKLAARDNLRIRDVPDKPGDNELLAQFTDLGGERYLLISFEQKTPGSAASRELAEKLFNSLEVSAQ
jgi:hypothetical protein